MQVEATLIEQTSLGDSTRTAKAGTLRAELHAWRRLFGPKLLRRTLIGVVMMIFQRASLNPCFRFLVLSHLSYSLTPARVQSGAGSTRCCTTARRSCTRWAYKETR